MQPSQLNSFTLPIQGSRAPATLMKAADVPLRVMVFNYGPSDAILAHEPETLSNIPVFANAWIIPINRDFTFVLAPGQGLYAVGSGDGVIVAMASSEAFPIVNGVVRDGRVI